ncbi:hypothetical protein EDC01DRAFT_593993, partial [Geopyxis carbonaria]
FPSAFGDPLRNFKDHCHELKAAEWRTVVRIAAPIFLRTLLPSDHYQAFIVLIEALNILESHKITDRDIETVEKNLTLFSEYYESTFYQRRWNNLRYCLPVFHQQAHVADFLRILGPMYAYAQWSMERV